MLWFFQEAPFTGAQYVVVYLVFSGFQRCPQFLQVQYISRGGFHSILQDVFLLLHSGQLRAYFGNISIFYSFTNML